MKAVTLWCSMVFWLKIGAGKNIAIVDRAVRARARCRLDPRFNADEGRVVIDGDDTAGDLRLTPQQQGVVFEE